MVFKELELVSSLKGSGRISVRKYLVFVCASSVFVFLESKGKHFASWMGLVAF